MAKVTLHFGNPENLVGQLIAATDGSLNTDQTALLAIAIQLARIEAHLGKLVGKPKEQPPVDSN